MVEVYLAKSKDLQKAMFVCHRSVTTYYSGEDISQFFDINWQDGWVREKCYTNEQWLEALRVDSTEKIRVLAEIRADQEFDEFDSSARWHGKLHFDFLKKYLVHLADARRRGRPPFNFAAKIVSDPAHPSLMSQLAAFTPPPESFVTFTRTYLATNNQAVSV